MARPFDVVVWGASGFTGRLVCEQLARQYQGKGVKWALAGRNQEKLEGVRREVAQFDVSVQDVPVLIGSLDSPPSLLSIAEQTKVIISTAGPYANIGTPIVEACVKGGCHYCDLTAEIAWMLEVRQKYEAEAKAKGVCIVHSCGYDSIPSDLLAFMIVDYIKRELKGSPGHMDTIVTEFHGEMSGGSMASMASMLWQVPKEVLELTTKPYCLNPPGSPFGRDPPDSWWAQWVPATREWAAPNAMQFINSPTVRRSAAILDYGSHFGYREVFRIPVPFLAVPLVAAAQLFMFLVGKSKTAQRLFVRMFHPQGSGPSRALMDREFWKIEVHAETHAEAGGKPHTVVAEAGDAHGDAGYLSTSRMMTEAALCLALQGKERKAAGLMDSGFPTPAAAMGHVLLDRLRERNFIFRIRSVDGRDLG